MSTKLQACWTSVGYLDSLIGGFILLVQGILTIVGQSGGNNLESYFGSLSFLTYIQPWISGLVMILLGFLILVLVWDWLQQKLRTGSLDNWIILGILLIILGIVAGGVGGIFVLVGGICYLIGGIKS
ncbi:MAG: hypothetical protein ACXABJ_09455 [Candidatus Heimdallarchaeaceae archaeon]|jgi:hypothetical protein